MDSFAIGTLVANKLIEDKVFESFIEDRYSSFTYGIGKEIVENKASFHTLEAYALNLGDIQNKSGREERLKSVLNQYLLEAISEFATV